MSVNGKRVLGEFQSERGPVVFIIRYNEVLLIVKACNLTCVACIVLQ